MKWNVQAVAQYRFFSSIQFYFHPMRIIFSVERCNRWLATATTLLHRHIDTFTLPKRFALLDNKVIVAVKACATKRDKSGKWPINPLAFWSLIGKAIISLATSSNNNNSNRRELRQPPIGSFSVSSPQWNGNCAKPNRQNSRLPPPPPPTTTQSGGPVFRLCAWFNRIVAVFDR